MKIPPAYGPEQTPRKSETSAGLDAQEKGASGSDIRSRTPQSGSDSVTISQSEKVSERAVYSMSELKGKADRALSAQKALRERRADNPEPLVDSRVGATRQELMELARLRVSAGFYNRADVIDAIAKRIIDNF